MTADDMSDREAESGGRMGRIAIGAAVALALATILLGAAYPLFLSTSVPMNDIVDFYHQFLEAGGFSGYGLADLYRWHNEHRLVVPKLWFLADLAVVDGRQSLLLLVIFLSALLHAALLAMVFRGLGHSWRATALAFVVAAGAMVSPVQYENLLFGFQVQFVQVWLFASLAFALIAVAPAEGERPFLLGLAVLGALLFGLASSYSMFNGLAVWPLLMVFAVWRRLPLVWTLTVVGVGGLVMAVEVTAFLNRPGGGSGLALGAGLDTLLLFMARYLTSAIGEIGTLGQEIVGLAAMAAVVVAGLYALVRPGRVPAMRMALLAVCAFVIAASLATGLGRLHIGLGAANASRYTTPSMVFLVTVGLLAFDGLLRLRIARALPWAVVASVVLLLVPGWAHALRDMPHRLAARDLAELTVVSHLAGGYRPEMLRHIYPHWPPRPGGVLDGLKAAGLGPYSEEKRFRPPEAALAAGPAVDAPLCEGSADRLRIDPVTGVTFAAWLSSAETGRQPPWVVARAPDGSVVAWGARKEARADRAPIPEPGILARGSRGFGPAPEPMIDRVTIEGVFDDGSRCRLLGMVAAMPDRYLEALPTGSRPVASEGWSFDGEPLAGGTDDAVAPQGASPLYGSFGLQDRRFSARFDLGDPEGARGVLLPLVTARWPFGTTIRLLDASGATLDSITLTRPVGPPWRWAALYPAVVSPGMRLEIITTERHGFNDVAFGTPHWLQ